MKRINLFLLSAMIVLGLAITSCNSGCSTDVKLTNMLDSVSYGIGINVGNNIKESLQSFPGDPVNEEAFIKGFLSAYRDTASKKMTPEDATTLINTYVMEAQTKEMAVNKAEEVTFFRENSAKEGVITTESGLQYRVLTEGTGKKPTVENEVRVHYTGKLLDGTVFDSSVDRGEPAVFGVTQVIRGWTEALQIMPVGSKYQVWIPSDLGYGEQGAGNIIKPNSTLEFEVELLEIVK